MKFIYMNNKSINITLLTPKHRFKTQGKQAERAAIRQLLLSNSPKNHLHNCHCHTQITPIRKMYSKKRKIKNSPDISCHKTINHAQDKHKRLKSSKLLILQLPNVNKKLRSKHKSSHTNTDFQIINNYMNVKVVQPQTSKKQYSIRSKFLNPENQKTIKSLQRSLERKGQKDALSCSKIKVKKKKISSVNKKFPPLFPQDNQESDKLDNITVVVPTPKKQTQRIRRNEEIMSSKNQKQDQWQQINPFQLQTYFVKLKKNGRSNQTSQFIQRRKQIPKIPQPQNITSFIKSYVPDYSEIHIQKLIKFQHFQVLHDNQQLYFGEMQNHKKQGQGILIQANVTYEGIWEDDEIQKGVEKNKNGIYNGTFVKRKRSGRGQFYWESGQYYNGEWKNGKKHGSGYWKSKKEDTYVGQWRNGEVTGFGIHTTFSGQKYEGQFVKFLKHGFGKQSFPNGDFYQGMYANGNPQGKGRYIWKCGILYDGIFQGGFRHGKGRLIVKNRLQFEGRFEKQYAEGKGTEKMQNGDEFKGEYKNGRRDGQGVLTLKEEKKIYKGKWVSNELEYQY